ncbi:SIR2 family protein (plasmid) [Methylobacterium currus]|uniref:SIR2 family protein n=1 Tax=Methylobacterium currus TaxID=2051553 RepID=UPI001E2DC1C5|nr:SIR2 family protein [Methylobacterium currus]UHC20422.1 SIR2 family protein [Methylobacterium currus]
MLTDLSFPRFIAQIAESISSSPNRFAFFLGAGCSVSSGVLPASTLVLKWIRERWRQEKGYTLRGSTALSAIDVESWYRKKSPDFDARSAGAAYSDVFKDRYPTIGMRRNEVAKFTSNLDPNIGYALLATLMSDAKFGGKVNTVITTNFDDLVSDALRIFHDQRALVIPHESLINFSTFAREAPVVIKLHGDALFDPLNTRDEIKKFNTNFTANIKHVLRGTSLIFLGYSGGDESVASALKSTGADRGDGDIYWVNSSLPTQPDLLEWLERRKAIWVNYSDFDITLLALAKALRLSEPTAKLSAERVRRFQAAKDIYEHKLSELLNDAGRAHPRSELRKIAKLTKKLNLDEKLNILVDVVRKFPKDAKLSGYYAQQLVRAGKNKEADYIYNECLKIDPNDVDNLCHYAGFIVDDHSSDISRDVRLGIAEFLLWRSTLVAPRNAKALGSYASFMWTRRRDIVRAERYFQKSLQCDTLNAETLASYGNFVWRAMGAQEEALAYYSYALDKHPASFRLLANSAQILFSAGRKGQACAYARTVLNNRKSSPTVKLECAFYLYALDESCSNSDYLKKIKYFIENGVRSYDWDLRPTIDTAKAEGRPVFLLNALAGVITHNEDANGLIEFSAWKDLESLT